MQKFLTMFVLEGLLFMILAIPLMQRRIRPNGWYGFRVRKTLSDSRIWYAANAYSGRQLFRTGMVTILAAFVLAMAPGIQPNNYAGLVTTVMVVDLLRGVFLSFRYLRKL